MKKLLKKLEGTFANAALLEMGVNTLYSSPTWKHPLKETLEEYLIEIAFAEAADFEDIHQTIQREHQDPEALIHPDDCQYGDHDMCFA